MRVLDLFSGIGGFSLGLERAGMQTVAFCEIEPYCRAVLKKHWPHVPCYEDVRTLTAERLAADGISVDVICGGFPCQDISTAGKQAGITAGRSGLWSELARIIGEARPCYAIVENVTNLLSGPGEQPGGWFGTVLGDLDAVGYDCQWHCIPAAAIGAPHIRDRVWIIAYPQHPDADQSGLHRPGVHKQRSPESADKQIRLAQSLGLLLANAASERCGEAGEHSERSPQRSSSSSEILANPENNGPGRRVEQPQSCEGAGHVAYTSVDGRQPRRTSDTTQEPQRWQSDRSGCDAPVAHADHSRLEIVIDGNAGQFETAVGSCGQWAIEPDVGRVAHGVPSRVDRLKSLGNAVVPQIPEIIGRAILASAAQ